ncbi:tapasin-related protein-like [Heptranchias perlo]|uniref:tapasin-related protein-like n=1 Tax=Heptranchias perlo TaxID=212740 RepID=UPI00355AAEDB
MFLKIFLLHFWILAAGIVQAQNGHTIPNRKVDCVFLEEKQNEEAHVFGPIITKRKALLLFGDINTNEEAITFKVKEPSLDIFQHVDEKPDKLECEISRHSTLGIQVPWPHQGKVPSEQVADIWFTVTVKHGKGRFTLTSFMRKIGEPESQKAENSETKTDAEDSSIGSTDTLLVQVTYIIRTSTPFIRTKLRQDLVLDCGYKIDHITDFNIEWRYQHRGTKKKLFSYNGRHQQVEHIEKGMEVFMDQIKNGNASLRIKNVGIKDEGSYTCSVYVPPLFGTHTINLEIMELPIVFMNTDSLSLKEGDEQKLQCDVGRYYPLDVTVKWLRQQREEHLLPVYMTNVVFSPHKQNIDGTYNVTSYFRFKASLNDNGIIYTCRVEHTSLEKPIKRSVRVTVEAQPQILLFILLSILTLFFFAIVIILLIHLKKVIEKNKKKPY